MQQRFDTEQAAREAARQLKGETCQIVKSKANGFRDGGPWVWYLETGHLMTMVRSWETLVHSGRGRDA